MPDGENGEPERRHPVSYVRDKKPRVTARVRLEPAAAFPGTITLAGQGPDDIEFPATQAQVVQAGGRTYAQVTNVVAEEPFADHVQRYGLEEEDNPFEVTWTMEWDGGQHSLEVGTSVNEVFVTLAAPPPPQYMTLYRTVAYLATAVGGAQTEQAAFADTWAAFTPLTGENDVCAWNEASEDYDRPLYYWQNTDPGPVNSVAELLQTANGNCDAWTRLFRESLRVNGADVDRVRVLPYEGEPREFWLVVKEVQFGPHQSFPGTGWPYAYDDIDRSPEGIAGQNMATPAEKAFAWHVVTGYIVQDPRSETYYDPSYGKTYEDEQNFTDAVIAGWGKQFLNEVRYRPGPDGEKVRFDTRPWPDQ